MTYKLITGDAWITAQAAAAVLSCSEISLGWRRKQKLKPGSSLRRHRSRDKWMYKLSDVYAFAEERNATEQVITPLWGLPDDTLIAAGQAGLMLRINPRTLVHIAKRLGHAFEYANGPFKCAVFTIETLKAIRDQQYRSQNVPHKVSVLVSAVAA